MSFGDMLYSFLWAVACLSGAAYADDQSHIVSNTGDRLVLEDMVIVAKQPDRNVTKEANGSISLEQYNVLAIAKALEENPGVEINFDIGFANNSKVLTADGRYMVDILASVIRFLGDEYQLEIHGHVESKGSNNSKKILSESRARTVSNQLLVNYGIQNHLTAVGLADARPINSSKAFNERSINNRISIVNNGLSQQLVRDNQ